MRDARPLGEVLAAPTRIAVIGASGDPQKQSGRPVRSLVDAGFTGEIIPVNPRRSETQGLPTYPSITDVPGRVDIASLIVPADRVLAELHRCAEAGVRLAVVFASGFAETGPDGAALQHEIGELCARTGLRVLGPNCLGAVSAANDVVLSFSAALGAHHDSGPTAMVSQSGALALWLYTGAQREGMRFSQFVNTGNEADLTVASVLVELVERDEVGCLLAYFEAVNDFPALREAARRARELDKPIVVMKAGSTEAGARAAVSHSGSLAGADRVIDAAFRGLGILRVNTAEALLDAARGFAPGRRASGSRLSVVSVSGGGGILMADAASRYGLDLVAWDQEWQDRMTAVIPSYGSPRNPVDVTASAGADPGMMEKALRLAAENPATDVIGVFAGDTGASQWWLEAIMRVHAETRKPMAVAWLGRAESSRVLTDAGVPVFPDAERAIAALGRVVHHGRFRSAPPAAVVSAEVPARARVVLDHARTGGRRRLDELEAAQVLEAFGIPIVPGRRAESADEAVAAADELGYPVVVKILSADIAHKSDIGGVVVGLHDATAVRKAAHQVLELAAEVGERGPALHLQPMRAGTEFVVGMFRDATVGPAVVVGAGGVLVEALDDVSLLVPPVSAAQAADAVASLRTSALLNALRGAAPRDRAALVDLVVAFSRMVEVLGDLVEEIDLNPVLVGEEGHGLIAVDALIVLAGGQGAE